MVRCLLWTAVIVWQEMCTLCGEVPGSTPWS
jgi:hypothetical protein